MNQRKLLFLFLSLALTSIHFVNAQTTTYYTQGNITITNTSGITVTAGKLYSAPTGGTEITNIPTANLATTEIVVGHTVTATTAISIGYLTFNNGTLITASTGSNTNVIVTVRLTGTGSISQSVANNRLAINPGATINNASLSTSGSQAATISLLGSSPATYTISGTCVLPGLQANATGSPANITVALSSNTFLTSNFASFSTSKVLSTPNDSSVKIYVPSSGTLFFSGGNGYLSKLTGSSFNLGTSGHIQNITVYDSLNVLSGALTVNTSTTLTLGSRAVAGFATTASLLINASSTVDFNNRPVTLRSASTGTARIQAIAGTLNNATNVTQQVFIPSNFRAFRLLGHPLSTSVPLSSLTSSIDITGSGGAANGFTTTANNNPSAFYFDNTKPIATAWTPFTNTSSTIAKWQGFRLLIRGAKGEGLNGEIPVTSGATSGQYVPSAVTLAYTGTINQGSQIIPIVPTDAVDSFVLVANPFPSPISLNLITPSANIASTYYIWNPQSWTSSQKGNWVNLAFTTPNVLPTGAAFFVKTTDGVAGSLTIAETNKSGSAVTNTVLSENNNESLLLHVKEEGVLVDQFELNLNQAAQLELDKYDGEKMLNSGVNIFSLTANKKKLSIDNRPFSTNEIPLSFTSRTYSNFTFSVGGFNFLAGKQIFLSDKYLNTLTELKSGIDYQFSVNADVASQGERFALLTKASEITNPLDISNLGLKATLLNNFSSNQFAVRISNAIDGKVSVKLFNTAGRLVQTSNLNAANDVVNIDATRLSSGLYLIQVQSGNESIILKAMKNP